MSENDLWNDAANAQLGPKVYFGQIFTDIFRCVLESGIGKVPFNPAEHSANRRRTCIKIDGVCTKADGTTYEIHREPLIENADWAGITLPSLKVCGVHPSELNERWASWEMVETGRTWESKQNPGTIVKGNTFKFLEFFDSEDACRAAEKAHYSRTSEDDEAEPDNSGLPMPEQEAPASNDAERANLAKFLPLLWTQAADDVVKFGQLLQGNPTLAAHFDLNSPEVQAVIGQ